MPETERQSRPLPERVDDAQERASAAVVESDGTSTCVADASSLSSGGKGRPPTPELESEPRSLPKKSGWSAMRKSELVARSQSPMAPVMLRPSSRAETQHADA